jgi:hypothetical protein
MPDEMLLEHFDVNGKRRRRNCYYNTPCQYKNCQGSDHHSGSFIDKPCPEPSIKDIFTAISDLMRIRNSLRDFYLNRMESVDNINLSRIGANLNPNFDFSCLTNVWWIKATDPYCGRYKHNVYSIDFSSNKLLNKEAKVKSS